MFFTASGKDDMIAICKICSARFLRGGKKFLTRQILLQLWNFKSSMSAPTSLPFLLSAVHKLQVRKLILNLKKGDYQFSEKMDLYLVALTFKITHLSLSV